MHKGAGAIVLRTARNATHWTGRAVAKAVGVSLRTVQRIWDGHRLQPHRLRTFKMSNDPAFAAKVEDVVGLYMEPPRHAVVLSMMRKARLSQATVDKRSLKRCTQPGLPLKPGKCATMTHDYKRNGTTTRFAALTVLDGTVLGRCMQKHRLSESSSRSWTPWSAPFRRERSSTPSSTITPPTSTPGSSNGWPTIRAGSSASRQHLRSGSTPSKASFPSSPEAHPSRRLQIRCRIGRCHSSHHPRSQRSRQAFCRDQNRQANFRQTQSPARTFFMSRCNRRQSTLVACGA
jgi:hypothetical protein